MKQKLIKITIYFFLGMFILSLIVGFPYISIPLIIAYTGYRIWLDRYFKSDEFLSIKHRIDHHINECNELNDHIEELKSTPLAPGIHSYGTSTFVDNSSWNFKRKYLNSKSAAPNVHNCSRNVCANSKNKPIEYVCKYFNFQADEETLEKVETVLNNFIAVNDGKKILIDEKKEILNSIDSEIPWIVKKFEQKKLSQKLGFKNIDLADTYYPKFIFEYVSDGGNAGLKNTIVMDINNLNAMVEYLNHKINWKKSIAGQRALMTSALRASILNRDNHTCKQCGISAAQEPHLLLEVDHIIPLAKGGITSVDNLQTLCWKCNRSKGSKLPTSNSTESE